jgi:hypothetical protein
MHYSQSTKPGYAVVGLRGVEQVLHKAGLPDCAEAFVRACQEADLLRPATTPAATSALQWQQQQQQQQQSSDSSVSAGPPSISQGKEAGDPFSSLVDDDGDDTSHGMPLELFDLLGQRTKMMPSTHRITGGKAISSAEQASGHDQLKIIQNEYDTYLCTLLASL